MIPRPDVGSSRVMRLALLAWLLLTENFEDHMVKSFQMCGCWKFILKEVDNGGVYKEAWED
jgi:hypothetical protein